MINIAQRDHPMLGITAAPTAASPEPNTRSSINDAATEMSDLIEAVKAVYDLDDDTLDKLAWRGDALLDQMAECRALSLCDVLLKLEVWRRLPPDLWRTTRIMDSAIVDLQSLTGNQPGVSRAPDRNER
jgi:hypothetical protein